MGGKPGVVGRPKLRAFLLMRRFYGQRSVERVWERLESDIKGKIVGGLLYKWKVKGEAYSYDEFYVEVQQLFFKNFYTYYESDEKYMAFLYVCAQNCLKNRFSKLRTRKKHFVSDPAAIAGEIGLRLKDTNDSYHVVWNNVSVKEKNDFVVKDILAEARKRLDRIGCQILDLLMEECNCWEICQQLDIKTNVLYEYRSRIQEVVRGLLNA